VTAEHPTTQSLWKDGSIMFGQARTKYGGSVQCMMNEVKTMSLEEQLPLVSLFVLHWLLPLSSISFDESQVVLKYALLSYIIMHSLFHFTSQWATARASSWLDAVSTAPRRSLGFICSDRCHCSSEMSLHESIHVSHLAFVPMLFSLWMHTGL